MRSVVSDDEADRSSKHSVECTGHTHTLSFNQRSGQWFLKHHDPFETDTSALDSSFSDKELSDSTQAPQSSRRHGASSQESLQRNHAAHQGQEPKFNPLALGTLTLGISIAVFLLSLDRTIVTTAIPTITDEFHSYADVGWYGSSYFLTSCAFQPLFGRIYQMAPIKPTYLISMALFEIGSIVSALAPQSNALIIGRAISGLGSAGILTGAFVVVAHSAPLHVRPAYTGIVGVFYSLGAVAGPLLGGLFTSLAKDIRWRWCFWINLPIGTLAIIVVVFLFKPRPILHLRNRSLREKISRLDILGNILLLAASIMFFLALQYNNSGIAWRNSKVIGLLVGAGVASVTLTGWQFWKGETALIPPRICLQRSVAFSFLTAFFIYGGLLTQSYFLPIWFQAIKGRSAVLSGVDMIPYLAAASFGSLFGGILVSKIGYFTPLSIIGSAVGTVGAGLFCTLEVHTPSGPWIGFSILCGAGLGTAVQQGFIAVQTVLSLEDVPIGTSGISFFQNLGGAVWVSIGDSLLINYLVDARIPGVDPTELVDAGATGFASKVPASILPLVMEQYNLALRRTFISATVLCGCAFLVSCGIEMKSVRKRQDTRTDE